MTQHEDYGRIDWKPRLKKWRVIGYIGTFGERNKTIGDFDTQQEAIKALQQHVKDIKRAC